MSASYNFDCIRDIMKYLQSALDFQYHDGTWNIIFVELDELYNLEELSSKYNKVDIMRSVLYMYNKSYIQASNITPRNQPYIEKCYIIDFTSDGQEFYSHIQNDGIWEATKKFIPKLGDFSSKTITSIAIKLAEKGISSLLTL